MKTLGTNIVLLALVLLGLSGAPQAQTSYPQATVRPARHGADAQPKTPRTGQPSSKNQSRENQVTGQRFPSRTRPPAEASSKIERNISRPPVAPSSYPKAAPRAQQTSGRSRAMQAVPEDEFRNQNHRAGWGHQDPYYDDYSYEDDWDYQDDQPWGRGYYDDYYHDNSYSHDPYYDYDYDYEDDYDYQDEAYYDDEPYYENYQPSGNSQYRGNSGSQYRNTRPKRKRGGLPRTHLPRQEVHFGW